MAKEQSILNRIVRWTETGLEYEADPRHAEIVVKEMHPYRTYDTPVDKERNRDMAKRTNLAMSPEHATIYRRLTARLNHLALDRPGIAFA